jgi:hypothetical protein
MASMPCASRLCLHGIIALGYINRHAHGKDSTSIAMLTEKTQPLKMSFG